MHHKRIGRYSEITVTTSSTVILTANPHRRYLRVSNPSAHTAYISFNGTAVSGQSFQITQKGVSEEFCYEDVGSGLTGDIAAIIDTANGFLAIFEGMEAPEPGSGTVGTSQAPFGMS